MSGRSSLFARAGLAGLTLSAVLLHSTPSWAKAPAIQGTWRLDSQASDDVAAQLAAHLEAIQSATSASRPPPVDPNAAGGKSGGMGGGGRGGGGRDGMGRGGRGAMDTEGLEGTGDNGEGLRALLMGGQLIDLSFANDQLNLVRDTGDPLEITVGARAIRQEDSFGHSAKVKAWWEDDVLVLRRKDGHGTMVEAFLPTDEPDKLYVVVELDSTRMAVPLAFRRVYQAVTPEEEEPEGESATEPAEPAPEEPAEPATKPAEPTPEEPATP